MTDLPTNQPAVVENGLELPQIAARFCQNGKAEVAIVLLASAVQVLFSRLPEADQMDAMLEANSVFLDYVSFDEEEK